MSLFKKLIFQVPVNSQIEINLCTFNVTKMEIMVFTKKSIILPTYLATPSFTQKNGFLESKIFNDLSMVKALGQVYFGQNHVEVRLNCN